MLRTRLSSLTIAQRKSKDTKGINYTVLQFHTYHSTVRSTLFSRVFWVGRAQ